MTDILCIDCEYSLRGLPREGRCPECGGEIAQSWLWHETLLARGEPPLWMSPPAWLRRMGYGCALVLASSLAVIAVSTLNSAFGVSGGIHEYVAVSIWIAANVALVAGLWLLGS